MTLRPFPSSHEATIGIGLVSYREIRKQSVIALGVSIEFTNYAGLGLYRSMLEGLYTVSSRVKRLSSVFLKSDRPEAP